MDGRALSHALFEAWNNRDWDTIRAALHPDYTYTGPDGTVTRGVEAGLQEAWISFADAFPTGRLEPGDVTVWTDGNTVISEVHAKLRHTGVSAGIEPTGNTVELELLNKMVLADDGRILEERDYLDTLGFFAQLGVIEPPD